ncbi:hypothetical protein C0Q70_18780 [Pomacea canaliculata]|uniref:Uncharacterized protein n=1 Tax=Pomacea canaliculata TaxID=400727 RepID=A0A2T7NHK2_POMCA|nr:hypothetical protein C0Q70_18780 [Pomacea canaliculata]
MTKEREIAHPGCWKLGKYLLSAWGAQWYLVAFTARSDAALDTSCPSVAVPPTNVLRERFPLECLPGESTPFTTRCRQRLQPTRAPSIAQIKGKYASLFTLPIVSL